MNKRHLVQKGYDQCAEKYLADRDRFKNQKYLEKLAVLLKKKAKILDVGCGAGVPIDQFLVERGYLVTGIDISTKQIELAKKNVPGADFIQMDMSQIDFSDESFEAIVSFYAIFHLPRGKHGSLLKRLARLLKPGGYLLITMGVSEWEGEEEDFHGTKMFWSHFDREKNLELITKTGFKILSEEIDTHGDEKHLMILGRKTNVQSSKESNNGYINCGDVVE